MSLKDQNLQIYPHEDIFEDFGLSGSSYKLSSKQAQAILDLRLQRLTGLEQDNLINEYEEVLQDIAALNEILENPDFLKFHLRQLCLVEPLHTR